MNIDELERQFLEKTIEISLEEAMLLDWVLTLHNWDESHIDWLMTPDVQTWRKQVGEVISGKEKTVVLTTDEIKLILVLIPITFRFAEKDVGYSLKLKLYKTYLGIEEVNNANKADNKTEGTTESSPSTTSQSFQS